MSVEPRPAADLAAAEDRAVRRAETRVLVRGIAIVLLLAAIIAAEILL